MNDMKLDFSVIILTCNRVERCLESVTHNVGRLVGKSAELIVVNNGTQPVSLPAEIDGVVIKVLQMSRNLGAEARNAGIAVARGRYIVFVDDDAYLPDGFAVDTWQVFCEHPDIAGISFRVDDKEGHEESCLLPSVFHGCACAFDRQWLDKVAGYPVGYQYYGEEYDLAFSIYAQSGRIILGNGVGAVRHIRDSAGRSKERIIRLLIRNNVYTWCRFLPLHLIKSAIQDTLQRYRLVALKEGALSGYRNGCLQLPWHMLRGLLHRQHLPSERSDCILLIRHLLDVFGSLPDKQQELIICGVGKFPTIWQQQLTAMGYVIKGYMDFNTCWHGQFIGGVPVTVCQSDAAPVCTKGKLYFTGLASLADNLKWHALFSAAKHRDVLQEMEQFAANRVLDLPCLGPFGLFKA